MSQEMKTVPPCSEDETKSDIAASLPSPGHASSIQAIDRSCVHRICSGQVVLNLATAIKELVENSVDAGATNIEIRLKEYGSELVEVIDNGSGVEEGNFAGLALKHHTSKLQEFSDLVNVNTFGFRGEALSSLCALSKLTVTTCHKEAKIGSKIEYNHNGKIIKVTASPRQTGTTVSLEQLFSTLPVRHKEFLRNLKKEFAKMAQVLNAYCLISTGVRISCTNQVGKGKKNIVVNTGGNNTLKENITNIFGAKQMQNLIPFQQISPNEELCSSFNVKTADKDNGKLFCVQGFVSSSEHGCGRSSADRQYYFINKRPCDVLKVSKLVNEVYHMYNRHQYPFVLLDVTLDKESVDVNVTPDKRMVFLQQEKLLLATLKASLIHLFEPRSSVYQVNRPSVGLSGRSPLKKHSSCPVRSPEKSLTSTLSCLKRSFSSAFSKDSPSAAGSGTSKRVENDSKQRKLDNFVRKSENRDFSQQPLLNFDQVTKVKTGDDVSDTTTNTQSPSDSQTSGVSSLSEEYQTPNSLLIDYSSSELYSPSLKTSQEVSVDPQINDVSKLRTMDLKGVIVTEERALSSDKRTNKEENSPLKKSAFTVSISEHSDSIATSSSDENVPENRLTTSRKLEDTTTGASTESHSEVGVTVTEYDAQDKKIERKEKRICFSMAALKKSLSRRSKTGQEAGQVLCRNFRAQISPGDNQTAEEELKKEISKDMFPSMEILGQFNLGFIIGKLGPDLFIIDQHATDEKYNFEMLQRHTILHGQKLIRPQNLQLTAMNEVILLDNLDILKSNGFEFIINEDAPCGERVGLSSMPVSKNWSFGKEDIEEMIFMLTDSPGVMCRPSRIRQMFASRACRKSIMIGTALNNSEMRKVVNHMGEIEQPWNCPHGRPTMRHLVNLNMISDGPQS